MVRLAVPVFSSLPVPVQLELQAVSSSASCSTMDTGSSVKGPLFEAPISPLAINTTIGLPAVNE